MKIPAIIGREATGTSWITCADDTVQPYDRALFPPKRNNRIEFNSDNRHYVVPLEDLVAAFRKTE